MFLVKTCISYLNVLNLFQPWCIWCFSSAEKYFLTNALCVGVPRSKWNGSLPLAPRAVFHFAVYACAVLRWFGQHVVSVLLSYSSCSFQCRSNKRRTSSFSLLKRLLFSWQLLRWRVKVKSLQAMFPIFFPTILMQPEERIFSPHSFVACFKKEKTDFAVTKRAFSFL